jgi:N-methylhydantoinase A
VPIAGRTLGTEQVERAVEGFHAEHEREYNFRLENDVELVNYHVVALNETEKLDLPPRAVSGATLEDALTGSRMVDFDVDGIHESAAYDLSRCEPGMEICGPAIIEDETTTIVVNPGCKAVMDGVGNIHIELGSRP